MYAMLHGDNNYVNCVNVLFACLFLFLVLAVFILLSFDE